jgi:glycosyltransferase involved in cell wall biosynthesis
MNIAHLLPYTAHFPLKKHNGRYEWALRLAEIQAGRGHDVSIYAAPGSAGGNNKILWKSMSHDFRNKKLNNIALIKTALQDGSHDIYHSHFDYLHYFTADSSAKPIVSTQHWFPGADDAAAVGFNLKRNVSVVPPTHYMAREDKRLGIPAAETIHHGIDLGLFKPGSEPAGDRLIFVGRISPNKGALEAVNIARAAKQPLDIVGKINQTDKPYWQQIEPLVDGEQIRYLGPKTQTEVVGLFQTAKAFVFPSQAQEAFGQVTIEAQACGTPVIISDVGASRELVDHGKSGFVAKSEADYIEAINNIGKIDRGDCRRFAEQFDLRAMVESYEELYLKLISEQGF